MVVWAVPVVRASVCGAGGKPSKCGLRVECGVGNTIARHDSELGEHSKLVLVSCIISHCAAVRKRG